MFRQTLPLPAEPHMEDKNRQKAIDLALASIEKEYGKTTLTLHAIAQVQKAGGVAAFIDAEHALDPAYARKLGVKTDELLVSQPDTGEEALEIVEALVRSGAGGGIVIDS